MNLREYRQLQAERGALESLLAEIPEGREIEQLGLLSRRRKIEGLLAAQPPLSREPLRARLTFRGKPIIGSQRVLRSCRRVGSQSERPAWGKRSLARS